MFKLSDKKLLECQSPFGKTPQVHFGNLCVVLGESKILFALGNNVAETQDLAWTWK